MTTDRDEESSDTNIAITKELRQALRAEITRTGITVISLLENSRNLPDSLTARTVNRWISGLVKMASRNELEYVMMLWSKLPDDPGRMTSDGRKLSRRGARHPAKNEPRIEVTAEMAASLRDELVRTGTPPASALRGVDDLPDGLNQRVFYGWLHREIISADPHHWDFVTSHLRSLAPQATQVKLRKIKE